MSRIRTVIVEDERRFPRAVAEELKRRHREAVVGAEGRVLDLSDPEARDEVASVIDGASSSGDRAWDRIVSVAELIRFPDLAAALAAIDSMLAPDGRLLAIEPVAKPGTTRVLTSAPWSITPWVRRFHVGRDLVAALRTTTLVNDDIDRFTIPTVVTPLRHFVALGARRVVVTTEVLQ